MIERPAERRVPLSPQLALRVAMLGGLALLLFGIILFRLWYLQVLSGPQYVQLAQQNQVRNVPIQAARGQIVDRDGYPIVKNQTATAVQIELPKLAPKGSHARAALFRRLGAVLGMSPHSIGRIVDNKLNVPYASVTIKTDASRSALVYLSENQAQFPAVQTTPIYLREYPYGNLAAQILGNVGQITAPELRETHFRGVTQGNIVGQAGLEYTYDRYLRGRNGAERVQVNARGQPTQTLSTVLPISGNQLRLSIDLGLEREGQSALQVGMGYAQANGNLGNAGAFVALNPNDGEVLAMGSWPTFDPSVFTKPMTTAQFRALQQSAGGVPGPLFNRATEGQYPTGSTFKPITALAALGAGIITPYTAQGGGECVNYGPQSFCNSGRTNYGDLQLENALQVSEDTYFYEVGGEAFAYGNGNAIQDEAHRLGLGRPTGIDLPGEGTGVVPDAHLFSEYNQVYHCSTKHPTSPYCPYTWTIGQNVQLATGQGSFLATPLQMAVAYSTIANGGTVVTPHLGLEVDDSEGRLIQQIQPPPERHIYVNPAYRQAILAGLHLAASTPSGTSGDVFVGWPQNRYPVYGKTGTAEFGPGRDYQSWYVCYVPAGPRSIVIAVTVENGGFGAQAAAPAARLMLAKWFGLPLKTAEGSSHTL
jgi:penicillin-binding protein 2